jgi:hypothetical protein
MGNIGSCNVEMTGLPGDVNLGADSDNTKNEQIKPLQETGINVSNPCRTSVRQR